MTEKSDMGRQNLSSTEAIPPWWTDDVTVSGSSCRTPTAPVPLLIITFRGRRGPDQAAGRPADAMVEAATDGAGAT